MKRLRQRNDLTTFPRTHNQEVRESPFELKQSGPQVHGLVMHVLLCGSLAVIYKQTSIQIDIAFQDILKLIFFFFFQSEVLLRLGRVGRRKIFFSFIEANIWLPRALRGTCDDPYFIDSEGVNDLAKVTSWGFEEKSVDFSCSFSYADVVCLHTCIYKPLLAFEKSHWTFWVFFHLKVGWVRRHWEGLTGSKKATGSVVLSPGAGRLLQGDSTLITTDESQREPRQNEDSLQKMRFVSRGQRNWIRVIEAGFTTLPLWRWLGKL